MIQEMNKSMLIYLNSLSEHTFFETMVHIFADSPIFFLPIFLIWAWVYATYKQKNAPENTKENLLFIFYGVSIALLISLSIQQVIMIERPETVLTGTGKLLLKHIPDASFPSDHATVSIAFLCGLFLAWYKKIGYWFFTFVILMNLSRVIAWVHWPLDIIAWALVWIIWSIWTFKILSKSKLVKILNQFIIRTLSYIKL